MVGRVPQRPRSDPRRCAYRRSPASPATRARPALVLAPAALGAQRRARRLRRRPTTRSSRTSGFILIVFFPLFVFVMSMLQRKLEKRKEARQGAARSCSAVPTGAAAGSPRLRLRPSPTPFATSATAPRRWSRSTARTGATRSTGDRAGAARGVSALRGRRGRARDGGRRRGRRLLLRGRRPEGDRDDGRAADVRGGPDGLHAAHLLQAHDRRHLRLLPRRRARARAVVRPAHRHARAPGSATPSAAGASR